jgi:hypothetical protein
VPAAFAWRAPSQFKLKEAHFSSVWQEKLLDEHQQKVSGGEAHLETMIKDLKSEISG